MIRVIAVMLAVVMIAAVFSPPVSAQVITGGLKTGVNFAGLRGEKTGSGFTKRRTGVSAGCFITFNFNETYAIQPELYYTMKGMRQKVEEVFESTIMVDYLEVPVLIVYSSETKDNVKFSFFTGPTFAYNQKSITKISPVEGKKEEKDLDTKVFDYGLTFGMDISIDAHYFKVILESRYTRGLTVINKDWSNNPGGEYFEVRNSVFSFLIGFAL
ncbi:hypothetical protein AMJ80_06065 [bacterium SM23_31]|nr:MAG: hypothetical protein AMJ80_06065 [bacterium SM23_31]